MVLKGSVWGPHSLHTAEATGSKPVTPTSTNRFLEPRCDACCQQLASKPPTVVAIALKALSRFEGLANFRARWEENLQRSVQVEFEVASAVVPEVEVVGGQVRLTCGLAYPL
jgi:hypothetical protein